MGTSWTIETQSDESDDWTVDNLDSLNSSAEQEAWALEPISANATGRSRVVGWGNWTLDELNVPLDDIDIDFDEIQADYEQWTIMSEPS